MQSFISNLLPRAKEYGKKLDRIESIVDKTWTIDGENGQLLTYRFKRNNILIIAVDGEFEELYWELVGDSIMIKSPGSTKGRVFRNGFILDGLFIVQKEGDNGQPSVFYNKDVVPDGDVVKYMKNYLKQKMNLRQLKFEKYFINYQTPLQPGTEVFDEDCQIVQTAEFQNGDKYVIVRNGKVDSVTYTKRYKTRQGTLIVYTATEIPSVGNRVEATWGNLADGEYLIMESSDFISFNIENGQIKNIREKKYKVLSIISLILIVLITFWALWIGYKKGQETSEFSTITPNAATVMPEATPASVDTLTAAPAVADTSDFVSESNLPAIRSKVALYYQAINERNYSRIADLLNINLNDFYGKKNIPYSQAVLSIREFWDAQDSKAGVISSDEDVQVRIGENEYEVLAKVFEISSKGYHKIPTVFIQNVQLTFNPSFFITKINATTDTSFGDFHRMFDIDGKAITIDDIKLRNRTDDFTKIFKTLRSIGQNNPSVAEEYKKVVLSTYGYFCGVYYKDQYYPLSRYIEGLVSGELSETYVYKVESNENGGKTIKIY